MRKKTTHKKNIPFEVSNAPKIRCKSPWSVKKVNVLANYMLEVTFNDDTHGFVEMKLLVMSKEAGVFAALRDVKLFNQAYIQYGAVTWPGEIDLAPDTMHEVIKRDGRYIISSSCALSK